jgi:rSAM/selenodomain-associated transferase 1
LIHYSQTLESIGIAVFARAPVPGQAKTRLIPRLGAQGAANLHRKLVERTLETVAGAQLGPIYLCCAPDAEHPFFADCEERFGARLLVQKGQDLGARMLHAFRLLLDRGPLLLVGCDCPAMTREDLHLAGSALREGEDAAFLPTEDGGYALIGLRQPWPGLFEDMPWGGDRVMAMTRARLAEAGLRWREPRVLWDVDRPEDLARLPSCGIEL